MTKFNEYEEQFITLYLFRLMNLNLTDFSFKELDNYRFMREYLSKCLAYNNDIRSEYLPEPIDYIVAYSIPTITAVDDFLIENRDKFFELFYYYKGLNSL